MQEVQLTTTYCRIRTARAVQGVSQLGSKEESAH